MNLRFSLIFTFSSVLFANMGECINIVNSNSSPVIGILTQNIYGKLESFYPDYKTVIVASYVKFIEGAGARVVPIWTGRDKSYYKEIINKTNGVLLPGGAQYFNDSNGYAEAGKMLYELAKEVNDQGGYYPIFGICLGMELLVYVSAGSKADDTRISCSAYNIPLNMKFKSGFRESKMFSSASEDEIDSFITEKSAHYHRFCITEKTLKESGIFDEWRVNSLSEDSTGITFISTIEHQKYPFFGVQFHPEKNLYEWREQKAVIHSYRTAKNSQYYANFFVNQSRFNSNSYKDREELQKYLIWNYDLEHTGRKPKVNYEQCYLFKE